MRPPASSGAQAVRVGWSSLLPVHERARGHPVSRTSFPWDRLDTARRARPSSRAASPWRRRHPGRPSSSGRPRWRAAPCWASPSPWARPAGRGASERRTPPVAEVRKRLRDRAAPCAAPGSHRPSSARAQASLLAATVCRDAASSAGRASRASRKARVGPAAPARRSSDRFLSRERCRSRSGDR
jgi:hypothetical protein